MREALVVQLEQLSYYHHQSLTGGTERPVQAFRILEVRGTRYFALSRIVDAGLDFTKRTNFLAHHLVFTSEEIATYAIPPLIFRYWDGWRSSWSEEPELLSSESWDSLEKIKLYAGDPSHEFSTAPARSWNELTQAAVNAFGLLDRRAPIWLAANGLTNDILLRLFAESLRMMELRNRDTDYHAKAWELSFITNLQTQDNPNDFKWRCLHFEGSNYGTSGASADAVPLQEVYSKAHTQEESDFATLGPKPAAILEVSPDQEVTEGDIITLEARVAGIPYPFIEWYWNGKCLQNDGRAKCVLRGLKAGPSLVCEVRVGNTYSQVSSGINVHVQAPIKLDKAKNKSVSSTKSEDSSEDLSKNTTWLINEILRESKRIASGTTAKFWEHVGNLDTMPEHRSLELVHGDDLKSLLKCCRAQRRSEQIDRIALRCSEEIKCRFRKDLKGYLQKHGKLALQIGGFVLFLLLIWKLCQFGSQKYHDYRHRSENTRSESNQAPAHR